MIPVVYRITCIESSKVYIGSSVNYVRRWANHKCDLRAGTHANPHLQGAWNKYGEASFVFEVIQIVPCVDRLESEEQSWIDWCRSFDPKLGYNLRPKAESNRGHKFSDETRARMSLSRNGKKRHPSIGAKISEIRKGVPLSEEHCASLRAAWQRRSRATSDETREKLSKAGLGRKWPQGSRRQAPISQETRAKMIASRLATHAKRRELEELFHNTPVEIHWNDGDSL